MAKCNCDINQLYRGEGHDHGCPETYPQPAATPPAPTTTPDDDDVEFEPWPGWPYF